MSLWTPWWRQLSNPYMKPLNNYFLSLTRIHRHSMITWWEENYTHVVIWSVHNEIVMSKNLIFCRLHWNYQEKLKRKRKSMYIILCEHTWRFIHYACACTYIYVHRRQKAMDDGLKKAIDVPLSVMKIAHSCWPHMITIATNGNITTLSDVQVTLTIASTYFKMLSNFSW